MWQVERRARVFLALDPVDMRKSYDGLSLWVSAELERQPTSGDLFVFSNRRRTMVKVLYYHRNGFCIWSKRLIKHRFVWPEDESEVRELRKHELGWLLEGLDIRDAHKKLSYKNVY